MKVYQTNEIRNIAIVGSAKSGKTTLAECMLFEGGLINRRGSIEDKNTVSDYRDIELERQNSVSSTVLYVEHNNKKINFIDVPGFDDFVGEVIASLYVADSALMVLNAQNGIELGAEIAWRHTSRDHKPVIFAINHLEHENSNFDETVRDMKATFGSHVTVCQYPVNQGIGFNSVIDLLKMKMLKFPDNGGAPQVLDIPANEKDKAEELYNELVEKCAESEESLMEQFFSNGTLSEAEIEKGLKMGLINRGIFPVMCINTKQNMGVGRLLEFIGQAAPSPKEIPFVKNTDGKVLEFDSSAPTSLFVFKTSEEPHLGEISYFKVFNGTVTESMDMVNPRNRSKERVSQVFASYGKNRTKLEKMEAGDIGSTIKLKNVSTNDTLNSLKNPDDVIVPIPFPQPKITMAVKAVNQGDEEKLASAFNSLHSSDPTITVEQSKELKQMIIGGQGELHLNLAKWLIEKNSKVAFEFISPKIPYRETITKIAAADYRHKKQSGGAGQFGEVHMLIEPFIEGAAENNRFKVGAKELVLNLKGKEEYEMDWGGKLIYYNCIVGGSIDARFMPAILKGIMEKMEEGPLTGSYARDIKVYVYDGKMHPVDSNEISFKLAGRNAFKEAFKNAGPKILEPVYDVEVIVPDEKMGDVMTDIQNRRGVIMGMEPEGRYQRIKARIPLAEMNRYSTTLSSLTSGRAMYSLKFAEYLQVPADVQTTLLKAYEEQEKDEE